MNNIGIIRINNKINELFNGKIDMSDLTEPDENHFLTRALASLALMMKCGLDAEDSSIHITDGYHDMGLDAIYLDESQKQLFLIQSKWRESGKGSVSQSEMQTFAEGIRRVINFDIEGANQKVASKETDIDLALTTIGYQIHAVYIHTGNERVNDYSQRPIQELMKSTNDEVATLIIFDEITYQDIYNYLAKGQDSDEISLDDVILSNWGTITSPYTAYYGIISAGAVGEWYKEFGNRLFAKNIRFYKGNTTVNDGMKKVILQEPENFVYYNNGIKLLCKSISRKIKTATNNETGLFKLDGVSLVNGAQTTGTIGEAYIENSEQTAKVKVMIQIIDLSQASDETAIQITKLSNTQNRIDNRDFASLDPIQEKIRQELSFSHFSYLYKTGDKISDPSCQITFDEAIVALACLNDDLSYATQAKRNVGALSEDITKPPYKIFFNEGTNSFEILNGVMILRYIDKELQKKKLELSGKEKLVTVHGNRFIGYCVLQELKKDDKFSKGLVFSEELQNKTEGIVDRLLDPITSAINELYAESYPANIFKNVTKCKSIFNKMNENK